MGDRRPDEGLDVGTALHDLRSVQAGQFGADDGGAELAAPAHDVHAALHAREAAHHEHRREGLVRLEQGARLLLGHAQGVPREEVLEATPRRDDAEAVTVHAARRLEARRPAQGERPLEGPVHLRPGGDDLEGWGSQEGRQGPQEGGLVVEVIECVGLGGHDQPDVRRLERLAVPGERGEFLAGPEDVHVLSPGEVQCPRHVVLPDETTRFEVRRRRALELRAVGVGVRDQHAASLELQGVRVRPDHREVLVEPDGGHARLRRVGGQAGGREHEGVFMTGCYRTLRASPVAFRAVSS